MKANEIQIGNWVYSTFCDKPCKVVGVEQYESGYANVKVTNVSGAKDIISLTPIPLTPEILEKNLATEPQIAWCVGWNKKDDIHVEIKREDLNASFYGVIDFVHELQHALRLCGIEKEIEL